MKSHRSLLRLSTAALLIACLGSSVSCMTTYDTYGRPVQSVDPGLAAVGVVAAGLVGYAAGNSNSNHDNHYRSAPAPAPCYNESRDDYHHSAPAPCYNDGGYSTYTRTTTTSYY